MLYYFRTISFASSPRNTILYSHISGVSELAYIDRLGNFVLRYGSRPERVFLPEVFVKKEWEF